MKSRLRFVQFGLIVVLTMFLSGCGRTYHIKGRVVFLPELGAQESLILELTGKPLPQGGRPMIGARVRLMHQLDKDGRPVKDSTWIRETVTDERGFFEIQDYASPSSEAKVGLEVSGAGYQTAYQTYIDYGEVEPQEFFVVLTPTRNADNAAPPTAPK